MHVVCVVAMLSEVDVKHKNADIVHCVVNGNHFTNPWICFSSGCAGNQDTNLIW